MKHVGKITVLAASLLATQCRMPSNLFSGKDTIARVGRSELTAFDIKQIVPQGLSGADSASYVDAYVEKWVVRQLKLQEAALMFPTDVDDIDRKVEEYRQSLLIRKIDQYYIDTEMNDDVSERDIADYYAAHRADFRITSPMVKGRIVAINDSYRRREQLVRLFASSKSDEQRDLEALCRKHNFRFVRFDEWTDFSEFLSNLPVLRSGHNETMLSKRGVQQIHYNRTYYNFLITDVLDADDAMPLQMVEERIRRILITRRQGELLRAHEDSMVNNAIKTGNVRIFGRDNDE
ncbi:MAG: hypothetical protein ACI35T_04420 [Alistipes sp.]